uniref:Uncharacterized protein n=1 Tax=Arundo donax TaxID=35708 RepID=A0A0A9AX07_ARUDO
MTVGASSPVSAFPDLHLKKITCDFSVLLVSLMDNANMLILFITALYSSKSFDAFPQKENDAVELLMLLCTFTLCDVPLPFGDQGRCSRQDSRVPVR